MSSEHDPFRNSPRCLLSRREALQRSALGLGSVALAVLLQSEDDAASAPVDPEVQPPHAPGRARAVIQLVQNGGPSQMDLFDPKPELQKRGGERIPGSVETFQMGNTTTLLRSPFSFTKRGQCGMELSEALPRLGEIADEISLVRSMFTEHNNHTEALVMLSTGKIFPGRPVLGAWISYALGSVNRDLPAYVVLRDPAGYNTSGKLVWASGWLPAVHQGTEFSSQGAPVLDLQPARPRPAGAQADDLEFIRTLNRAHRRRFPDESELDARLQNYELAARMQLEAPRVLDIARETPATRKLYGLDDPITAGYGTRLLMARRLVEAGVRFVQVFPPVKPQFQPWDSHTNSKSEIEAIAAQTDLPAAALVRDLKARGLLESTLVIWSGEFGRLPVSQGSLGRDHNRNAFSLWLAGGGVRRGCVHGGTDEFGYKAVQDRVSVPDLHATVLHQLGIDHRRLWYRHQGRAETPTDAAVTGARVVTEILESADQSGSSSKQPASQL